MNSKYFYYVYGILELLREKTETNTIQNEKLYVKLHEDKHLFAVVFEELHLNGYLMDSVEIDWDKIEENRVIGEINRLRVGRVRPTIKGMQFLLLDPMMIRIRENEKDIKQ